MMVVAKAEFAQSYMHHALMNRWYEGLAADRVSISLLLKRFSPKGSPGTSRSEGYEGPEREPSRSGLIWVNT